MCGKPLPSVLAIFLSRCDEDAAGRLDGRVQYVSSCILKVFNMNALSFDLLPRDHKKTSGACGKPLPSVQAIFLSLCDKDAAGRLDGRVQY
ncbi:hypothetical protein PoB_001009900, partial [Plakobranchus ocellatus]